MLYQLMERQTKSVIKKENVYITGCDTEEAVFRTIGKEILEVWDCKVYINDGVIIDIDEHFMQLEQMNLVIMLVTKQFLLEDNFARNTEFAFIKEKGISVLPILLEEGLERLFNSVCGDIHLLNRGYADYMSNLAVHLEKAFGDDELFEKIPNVFSAGFFLSYRKKDRQYALQLLQLLHSFSCCEDVSIWFDDFLTLGENYDEEIDSYLRDSDLFLLAVTPSLLEDGNYVMNIEYPRAVALGKRILPVELVPTNEALLYEKYAGLPEIISASDLLSLERVCEEVRQNSKEEQTSSLAEKEYYLGQAYLKGIGVEINRKLGLQLLVKSAEKGYLKASNYLGYMYCAGDGVERDYSKAKLWLGKNVALLEQGLQQEGGVEWARALAQALMNLCDCYIQLGNMDQAKMRLNQLAQISAFLQKEGFCGTGTNLGNVWMRMGILNAQNNNLDEAFACYCKAEPILEEMYRLSETPQSIQSYAQLSGLQGEYYSTLHKMTRKRTHIYAAAEYYENAKMLWKKLVEAYKKKEETETLINICFNLGHVYQTISVQEEDVVIKQNAAKRSLEQYDQIYELKDFCSKEQIVDCLYMYAVASNVLGGLYESVKEMESARFYYKCAYDVYKILCNESSRGEYYVGLATAAVNYAVVGAPVPNRELLLEALEIMDALCQIQPHNEQYAGFRMTIVQRINAWPRNLG